MKNSPDEILGKHKLVLVDFFATWCAPCKQIPPVLKQVQKALDFEVQMVEINVDLHKDLIEKYAIRGVPALILFKDNTIVWRHYGLIEASELLPIIKEKYHTDLEEITTQLK